MFSSFNQTHPLLSSLNSSPIVTLPDGRSPIDNYYNMMLKIIESYVITESQVLLSSTELSIQEIALKLNFPSQSVFGKYFKRITGLSPKEYRNRRI